MTADERYELFVDGQRVARGPERGDRANWFFESFDIHFKPGDHEIIARVHAIGKGRPWAQISVAPGLLVCVEDPTLQSYVATGVAPWKVRLRSDITTRACADIPGIGTGPEFVIDAKNASSGLDWEDPIVGERGNDHFSLYVNEPVHWMTPATLPAMLAESWSSAKARALSSEDAQRLLAGTPWTVAARTFERVVIDLAEYACVYPSVSVEGGANARIDLRFAEALFHVGTDGKRRKSNRDLTEGATFLGYGDTFICDGGPRTFEVPWWRCGRFVELTVQTADEPLTISRLRFEETRYPLSIDSQWQVDDARESTLFARCLRTLQMCMHETYMDCPFYEQLMYVGDTRIQALMTYALSCDDRLPRKALRLFDGSRSNPTGLTTSNHPASAGQMIAPFALWHVCMIDDYAMFRGDRDFVRSLLPGARAIADVFLHSIDDAGLHRSLNGWNFADWSFPRGIPPGGEPGEASALLNLQLVLALDAMTRLESFAGEPELRDRYARRANELYGAMRRNFWDDGRQLFADDNSREHFSEHAQLLAICTKRLTTDVARSLAHRIVANAGLRPTQMFFSHYRFDAAAICGVAELIDSAMPNWFAQLDRGLLTMPETSDEQTRSDCHAWSAHPLYHLFTTIAGVRPDAPGFARVRIAPLLGKRERLDVSIPHPLGRVRVALQRRVEKLVATIESPVAGSFCVGESVQLFEAGRHELQA